MNITSGRMVHVEDHPQVCANLEGMPMSSDSVLSVVPVRSHPSLSIFIIINDNIYVIKVSQK